MLLGQRIVQGTGRSIRTEPVHHCRGAFSGCRTCQRDSTHARREEVPKARIGKHRRSEMHSAGIFPTVRPNTRSWPGKLRTLPAGTRAECGNHGLCCFCCGVAWCCWAVYNGGSFSTQHTN